MANAPANKRDRPEIRICAYYELNQAV
jgi:hypothetical protein